MKKLALLLLVLSSAAFGADVWVNGYTRQDGTYVAGHYRTAPDNNPYNNYSTQGNINPYTGQEGTRNPYEAQQQQPQQYTPPQAYQPMPTLSPMPTYRAPQRGDSAQH